MKIMTKLRKNLSYCYRLIFDYVDDEEEKLCSNCRK